MFIGYGLIPVSLDSWTTPEQSTGFLMEATILVHFHNHGNL